MRCLTLADALQAQGVECHFICREHPGHLIAMIRGRGHEAHSLPLQEIAWQAESDDGAIVMAHAHWLGGTIAHDAQACLPVVASLRPDWLIVDHYALDAQWETAQRPYCRKIMAIDDLADRRHDCDLLLDQTLGRRAADYQSLVPAHCEILCGSRYALLRPEFAQWRPNSLARRQNPVLKHLLITMGGVDRDNVTGKVLDALTPDCLPKDCRISVVMGPNAPWLEQVQHKAAQLPWPAEVLVGVCDMARLMTESDLAIGAAGATSWERCCMGLPTVMMVLADNQINISSALEKKNAAAVIDGNCLAESLRDVLKNIGTRELMEMSSCSKEVCDGTGAVKIVMKINGVYYPCV